MNASCIMQPGIRGHEHTGSECILCVLAAQDADDFNDIDFHPIINRMRPADTAPIPFPGKVDGRIKIRLDSNLFEAIEESHIVAVSLPFPEFEDPIAVNSPQILFGSLA